MMKKELYILEIAIARTAPSPSRTSVYTLSNPKALFLQPLSTLRLLFITLL